VAFYQARAGAVGSDHLVYLVTNPTGEMATYDVTITIREAPKPSPPGKDQRI
jgi:hypothetical protein